MKKDGTNQDVNSETTDPLSTKTLTLTQNVPKETESLQISAYTAHPQINIYFFKFQNVME